MSKKHPTGPRIEPTSLDVCLAMAHKRNPKEHDLSTLIESFQRFGFKAFPSVDEATKTMVAGHGRCLALKQMRDEGYPPPKGIEVDGSDWIVPVVRGMSFDSERERDAYIVADNKLTERGGWNMDLLQDFLGPIAASEAGFRGLGFADEELATLGFSSSLSEGGDGLLSGGEGAGADRFDDANLPASDGETTDEPKKYEHKVRPPAQMTNDDWTVHLGKSEEILRSLPDNSIDAIVTDPPAGISFMGREWDSDKGGRDAWVEWLRSIMAECFRVLKPGGHVLSWALPRTSHWTAYAIENAGFEIRDRVSHLFGSGFPKSLDVSKAIDKKLGVERTNIIRTEKRMNEPSGLQKVDGGERVPVERVIAAPESDHAKRADGYGTALKPALEDWWLARKPLDGTVAENFMRWGTGALNIEGCRIGDEERFNPSASSIYSLGEKPMSDAGGTDAIGRWPSHLVLQHASGCEATGTVEDSRIVNVGERIGDGSRTLEFGMGKMSTTTTTTTTTVYRCVEGCPVRALDEQKEGASRFFYVAKPSKAETEAGLDDLPEQTAGELTGGRKEGSDGLKSPRAGAGRGGGRKNIHPTKKPIELMRYLVRMIAPPPRDGIAPIVLDPFAGSGTTGLAALVEGCRFVGIELLPAHRDIACARLSSIIEDPRRIEDADAEREPVSVEGEASES
jgi:DNA modification methylase